MFYSFFKNYSTSASTGNLCSTIVFKLCKFSVNLWTLCFLSDRKYTDPLSIILHFENSNLSTFGIILFTQMYFWSSTFEYQLVA